MISLLTALPNSAAHDNCKLSLFLTLTAIGSLCFATLIMTLYKFVLIRSPLNSWNYTTVVKQILLCIASFLLVAVTSSSFIWFPSTYADIGTKRLFCFFKGSAYQKFVYVWISSVLLIPLITTLVMMVMILIAVQKHKNMMREISVSPINYTAVATTSVTTASVTVPASTDPLSTIVNHVRSLSITRPTTNARPRPTFPWSTIVSLVITLGTTIPAIPSLVNISWYYKRPRILLDISYSFMLLCVVSAPYLHIMMLKMLRRKCAGVLRDRFPSLPGCLSS